MELLLGCGNSRQKRLWIDEGADWKELVTLDIDPSCKPDIVHDLNVLPYPFEDNTFDEIHAYEVLEHCGRQGDYKFFFAQFTELHRILKPSGKLYVTVPYFSGMWAWGDPGHTRVIAPGSLFFLEQAAYKQIGTTAMTDYRGIYKVDFKRIAEHVKDEGYHFVLEAVKPLTDKPLVCDNMESKQEDLPLEECNDGKISE